MIALPAPPDPKVFSQQNFQELKDNIYLSELIQEYSTKEPLGMYICGSFNTYNVGTRLGRFHDNKLNMEHSYQSGQRDIEIWVEDDKHNIIDMRKYMKEHPHLKLNGYIKLSLCIS
jgi:hypothetical protein